ncbi:hypothetical protein H4R20_002667 [Coemansia guatemalensis]|uniref:SCP domain-containing protein n=1 Tax=Coemansia guatemalensis TaxID=2761395 RepID=A0A9W8I113_9FUNG|nr:hypothetical protein H4R20_002667 [Coemansia guatemalensis]
MLCLINALRGDQNLFPVVYHDKLIQLAQGHAEFQSMHRAVTHVDGAGQIGDRLTRLGFQWSVLAENVGAGAPNVTAMMDGWIKSPHHLANMLHPDIRYLGAGVSKGYWVQDFAAPMGRGHDLVKDKIEACPSTNMLTIYM